MSSYRPKEPTEVIQETIRQLEQHLTFPLSANQHIQTLKQTYIIEDNLRNYVKYGIHKTLHLAYHKKRNSVSDLIEVLEIVHEFSKFPAYSHPIAIHGHFLQEGYVFLSNNIRLVDIEELAFARRDSMGNYLAPSKMPSRPYTTVMKLDRILPENVPVLLLWIKIMANFMQNEKSAQFSLTQKYIIFLQCFACLSKIESDTNLDIELKNQLKDHFYSFLLSSLKYTSLRNYLLDDPDLINWVFVLIEASHNFADYVRSYQVLDLLTQHSEFTSFVGDKKLLHDFIYQKMVALVFSIERSTTESFLFADKEQTKIISQLITKIFHTLTSHQADVLAAINMIKANKTDILLRFFLFSTKMQDQFSAVYIAFAILNVLKSDEYEFPAFSSKLGLYLVASLIRRDDFMLMLLLRIIKYIRFTPDEKIFIFKMLLTPETSQPISVTLEDIDQIIYKKNPIELKKTISIRKDISQIMYSEDEDSEDDSFEEPHKTEDEEDDEDKISQADKSREEKVFNKSQHPNEETKSKKEDKKEKAIKDDDFYYKKKLFKDKQFSRKKRYDFINDSGQEFLFIKHCDGVCPFCNHYKGLFALDHQEFLKYSLKELEKDGLVTEFEPTDLALSIFQTIFDLTFGEDISFLYYGVIPKYCKFLTSDALPAKYRFPILLYFSHILVNFPKGIQILYGVSFFVYAEDFISDFLVNFELASFKKEKPLQKLTVMVPKKAPLEQPSENPQQLPSNTDKKGNKTKPDKSQKSSSKDVDFKLKQQQTIIEMHKHGKDIQIEFEEVEINAIGVVLWDANRNCYMQIPKELNDNYQNEMQQDNKDEVTDDGKFTKYFWRLHFLYHIFKVLLETVRRHSKSSKQILLSQLEHFMEQIRDTTVIFLKYSEKMIPTAPFHEDTECWFEMKNLMFETLGILQEIQYILISRFPKFSNSLFSIFDLNLPTLANYVALIGKLPTLDSTISLISTLLLYFSLESPGVIKPKQKNSPLIEICKKFFENVAREFSRIKPAISSVLQANEKDINSIEIVNKRVVSNTLKLGICTLQTLNLLISKARLPFEELNEDSLNDYYATLSIMMRMSRVLYLKTEAKKRSLENNVFLRDPRVIEDAKENVIKDDEILYEKFISICGLNVWQFSHNFRASKLIPNHEIIPFIIKYINILEMDRDTSFSFFAAFHDICYNARSLEKIIQKYPDFVKDIVKLLANSHDMPRVLIIPLLRGIRFGLDSDTALGQEFRGLIHLLRHLITDDDPHNELSSILKPQTKQTIDDESLIDALKMNSKKDRNTDRDSDLRTLTHALGLIDDHPSATSIHKRIRGKSDKDLFDGEYQSQIKLLQKEARLLMKIVGVTNKVELNEEISKKNNPRKKVTEGAGLLSDNTANALYMDQKKKDMYNLQEHIKTKLKDSNFSILIGNSLPFSAAREHSAFLPPSKQANYKVYDSLDVGLASFRAQRDLDRVVTRSVLLDDGIARKMGVTKRDGSLKNEKVVSWKALPEDENQTLKANIKKQSQVSKNSSILRDNGKNIMQIVDAEYTKLLTQQ